LRIQRQPLLKAPHLIFWPVPGLFRPVVRLAIRQQILLLLYDLLVTLSI